MEEPLVRSRPRSDSGGHLPCTPNPADCGKARRLLNRAARLLEENQAEKALPLLQRALGLDATSAPILLNLGAAYVMMGRFREAIPVLEAARELEPGNPMIWTNLGCAYLGNPALATPELQELAIAGFQRALALDPLAPNVHYNLGLIYVDRGDVDRAAEAFRRAIEANPSDRDAAAWLRRIAAVGADASPQYPQTEPQEEE
jgi:tetratricopeptide (TPR) repeat protein